LEVKRTKDEGRKKEDERNSTDVEEKRKVDICERTFQFSLRIIKVCQEMERKDGIARVLSKQLLRSGTSIGANVEEGQGGQSRADFIAKYSIARKETRETAYWLRLIGASGIIPASRLRHLLAECGELLAILTAILKKARSHS
jgi:four helix bundle protein